MGLRLFGGRHRFMSRDFFDLSLGGSDRITLTVILFSQRLVSTLFIERYDKLCLRPS